MAKDFWIDYSDPPFPAIAHRSHPKFDSRFHEVMTLRQARDEIKQRCRQERQHWLAVMHHQTDRSAEAIIKEAIDMGKTE